MQLDLYLFVCVGGGGGGSEIRTLGLVIYVVFMDSKTLFARARVCTFYERNMCMSICIYNKCSNCCSPTVWQKLRQFIIKKLEIVFVKLRR